MRSPKELVMRPVTGQSVGAAEARTHSARDVVCRKPRLMLDMATPLIAEARNA